MNTHAYLRPNSVDPMKLRHPPGSFSRALTSPLFQSRCRYAWRTAADGEIPIESTCSFGLSDDSPGITKPASWAGYRKVAGYGDTERTRR